MLEHLLSVSETPGSTSRAEKKRTQYTKQEGKSERDSEVLSKRMRVRKIIISCIPGTDADAWEKIKRSPILVTLVFVCLNMQNKSTIDAIKSKLNYAVESNKCYGK